ncbi:MAG: hypothetical protein GF355_16140, partial [Candidatus Eisenbacteria bacterium]|nr:hypothetical protein [Candidatus Eisenbacteria bacterium]
GRRIRTLADGPVGAGTHTAVWDGRDEQGQPAAAGVYFARMRAPEFEERRSLILVR